MFQDKIEELYLRVPTRVNLRRSEMVLPKSLAEYNNEVASSMDRYGLFSRITSDPTYEEFKKGRLINRVNIIPSIYFAKNEGVPKIRKADW